MRTRRARRRDREYWLRAAAVKRARKAMLLAAARQVVRGVATPGVAGPIFDALVGLTRERLRYYPRLRLFDVDRSYFAYPGSDIHLTAR